MTTNFRAMCAELTTALEAVDNLANLAFHHYAWDGRRPKVVQELIDRARALLDQSELCDLHREMLAESAARGARGDLAQPVPVSERLPVPEDCNGDGDVWAWRRFDPEGDMDNGDFWCLAFCEWLEDEDCNFTHWLPANALPTPEPHAQ